MINGCELHSKIYTVNQSVPLGVWPWTFVTPNTLTFYLWPTSTEVLHNCISCLTETVNILYNDNEMTDIHEQGSNKAASWTGLNFKGKYINLVVIESWMSGKSPDKLIALFGVGTPVAIWG